MAVFENQPSNENWFDDSVPLTCIIQNYRIIEGHTVSEKIIFRNTMNSFTLYYKITFSFVHIRSISSKFNVDLQNQKHGPFLNVIVNFYPFIKICKL